MSNKNHNSKGFSDEKHKPIKKEKQNSCLPKISELIYQRIESEIRKGNWRDAYKIYSDIYKDSVLSAKNKEIRTQHLLISGLKEASLGNTSLAISHQLEILSFDEENRFAFRNLAILLKQLGLPKDAISFAEKYLGVNPDCSQGWNTYGTLMAEIGLHEKAISSYKKALKIDPLSPEANCNLAGEYHLLAKIDMAYAYSTKSVALQPERHDLWQDHLTQLRRVCDFDRLEKIDWWGVISKCDIHNLQTAFLQLLVNSEHMKDQKAFLDTVVKWSKKITSLQDPETITFQQLKSRNPKASETFSIGLVSSDFKDHSVARFIWPLFKFLDKSEYQLFCYSTQPSNDEWTQKFKSNSNKFIDISSCSLNDIRTQIINDEIDILIDLTGFTKGSKTKLFSMRCAPMQMSWLGFPGTVGLKNMDYIFTDNYLAPLDHSLITEQPLITEGTTVCFTEMPEITITDILPSEKRGYITFGTLNNPYKFTRACIKRWAQIMADIEDSKFLFVRREFESYFLRENIKKEFAKYGIKDSRIYFLNNRKAQRHYLDTYNEIDISLDTYPVTGGTTTTDALWMGVPVICLEGINIHQRVCSAILRHANHPEWICQKEEHYSKLAVEVAQNKELRARLRKQLRRDLKASKLCDEKQFATDFSKAIQIGYRNLMN